MMGATASSPIAFISASITSATSLACVSSVPAAALAALPGVFPDVPCARSDTDRVARPLSAKYPAKCSSQHHAA